MPLAHGWRHLQVYMPENVLSLFRNSKYYESQYSDSKNARRFIELVLSIEGDSLGESLEDLGLRDVEFKEVL